MSFGNSKVFPFPAVQYIPMGITTICQGEILGTTPKAAIPILVAGNDIKNWEKTLVEDYGITLPTYLPDGGFPIISLNMLIQEAHYRGFNLTMTGEPTPLQYQYFTVPQRYFYKTKLFFEVYNLTDNALLARYSFFMPELNRIKQISPK